LPLLGRGLHHLQHEPTHQALASARSARDLFERWQRLERYLHSKHRCVVDACTDKVAQIRHIALGGRSPPSAAEDLVVAGVLAALLEAIGLRQVRVFMGAAMVYPEPQAADIEQAARRGQTALWHFFWEAAVAGVAPRQVQGVAQELGADPAWPGVARAVYWELVRAPTQPASLHELATQLSLSRRTLQRRLGECGLGYASLLAEARCRSGAWRLLHTKDPIAEVGFLSGFADQPHFTREMQRRVGLPPSAYRAAFSNVGQGVAAQPDQQRKQKSEQLTEQLTEQRRVPLSAPSRPPTGSTAANPPAD
jgi:AraC-like DNA-binding protein